MYGTYYEVTKTNILKRATPFEIVSHYIPWFVPGKSIKSPFIDEKRASFWSTVDEYGKIYFKDFGRGYSGDCFELVMLLRSCMFREALDHINNDLKLGLGASGEHHSDTTWQLKMMEREKKVASATPKMSIKYNERTILTHDYHFWSSYGMLPFYRKLFGIVPIDGFWIEGAYNKADKFAYAWHTENGVKIYQPFNDRGYKWRSNTNNESLQGEKYLPPKGRLLLFQSSLKDIGCVVSRYKIGGVGPNGEHGRIPLEKLENYERRFDRIGVMYDNDSEGIKAATKLHEERGYEMFILPHIAEGVVDPSDFVNRGYQTTLDLFFIQDVIKMDNKYKNVEKYDVNIRDSNTDTRSTPTSVQ
jgi:hypothetical protein